MELKFTSPFDRNRHRKEISEDCENDSKSTVNSKLNNPKHKDFNNSCGPIGKSENNSGCDKKYTQSTIKLVNVNNPMYTSVVNSLKSEDPKNTINSSLDVKSLQSLINILNDTKPNFIPVDDCLKPQRLKNEVKLEKKVKIPLNTPVLNTLINVSLKCLKCKSYYKNDEIIRFTKQRELILRTKTIRVSRAFYEINKENRNLMEFFDWSDFRIPSFDVSTTEVMILRKKKCIHNVKIECTVENSSEKKIEDNIYRNRSCSNHHRIYSPRFYVARFGDYVLESSYSYTNNINDNNEIYQVNTEIKDKSILKRMETGARPNCNKRVKFA